MHHKRKRRKNARAGCLMCKWWKATEFKDSVQAQTFQERKARVTESEYRRDLK